MRNQCLPWIRHYPFSQVPPSDLCTDISVLLRTAESPCLARRWLCYKVTWFSLSQIIFVLLPSTQHLSIWVIMSAFSFFSLFLKISYVVSMSLPHFLHISMRRSSSFKCLRQLHQCFLSLYNPAIRLSNKFNWDLTSPLWAVFQPLRLPFDFSHWWPGVLVSWYQKYHNSASLPSIWYFWLLHFSVIS